MTSLFRRQRPQGETRVEVDRAEALAPEVHASPGLEATIARLGGDNTWSVLDLGGAVGTNVEFFAGRARRLFIADIPRALEAGFGAEGATGNQTARRLLQLLPSDPESFDLVLAWDLVNYLSRDQTRSLARAVADLCRPGAVLLALVVTAHEMPSRPVTYAIREPGHLVYRRGDTELRPGPRLTPAAVERALEGFVIEHSYVLRHGVQEFVAVLE
jgi:hypothetical protein